MSRRRRSTLPIQDLQPDPANHRRRTPRGQQMLSDAIRDVGAARSIVIDEDNVIRAGNGVVEAAIAVGVQKVTIVEADGDTLIAVRRRNLSPEQKRRLALYDNRTGELAEWVPEQIAADVSAGLEMQPFFTDKEVQHLAKHRGGNAPKVEEVQTGAVADKFWISVRGPLAQQAKALQRLQEVMREIDGVHVELGTMTGAIDDEAWAPAS